MQVVFADEKFANQHLKIFVCENRQEKILICENFRAIKKEGRYSFINPTYIIIPIYY